MPSPNPYGQPNSQTQTTTKRYTYGDLKKLWVQAGGSAASAPIAAAVALAESSGNPNAINDKNSDGSIDRGLWQINSVHGAQSTTDIMANARAAVAISNHGTNWNPWTTFKDGKYKKFLNLSDDKTAGGANQSDFADSVDGVGNTIGGVVTDSASAFASIGKFLASLVNPQTWLHVLEVVGGVILLVMGLRVLTGNSAVPPMSSAVKAVA